MKKIVLAFLTFTPAFVFAQNLSNVLNLVQAIGDVVSAALPIVVGIALLAFFWGLVKFIFAQGNEDAKADAKKIMLWGLIALFVMIAVWGLVRFIGTAFNVDLDETITVPVVPGL